MNSIKKITTVYRFERGFIKIVMKDFRIFYVAIHKCDSRMWEAWVRNAVISSMIESSRVIIETVLTNQFLNDAEDNNPVLFEIQMRKDIDNEWHWNTNINVRNRCHEDL